MLVRVYPGTVRAQPVSPPKRSYTGVTHKDLGNHHFGNEETDKRS
jgi:hypothetical protein